MNTFIRHFCIIGILWLASMPTVFAQEILPEEEAIDSQQEKSERIATILAPRLEDIPLHLLVSRETLSVDLSREALALAELYEENQLIFTWDIEWLDEPLITPQLETKLQQIGLRNIVLEVQEEGVSESGESIITALYSYPFEIFVYEQSLLKIGATSTGKTEKMFATEWILLYDLMSDRELSLQDEIQEYKKWMNGPIQDFILFLGTADEIDANTALFHEANIAQPFSDPLNIIFLSEDHPELIQRRIQASLSGAPWAGTALAVEDIAARNLIGKGSTLDITTELERKGYEYTSLWGQEQTISATQPLLRFINTAYRSWATQKEIYLLLIIPLILTWIAIMRNFIWLTTIGIFLPTYLTIMTVYYNSWWAIGLYVWVIVGHLILKKITPTSTLLHTPKIVFLLSVTIFLGLIIYTYLFEFFGPFEIEITDILAAILGILTMESLISIVWGREFSEAWEGVVYTGIFAAVAGLLLSIPALQRTLMTYPEILLITLLISIYLARYRGLRMTEYFRFRTLLGSSAYEE